MHRLILLFVCLFVFVSPLLAQEEEEEDILPPRRQMPSKIGGGAGFTQNLLFLNLDPINEVLRRNNLATFDKNPVFMLGGQGYGYILVLPNVRIGGMGAGGSIGLKEVRLGPPDTLRQVELGVGYGGVTIDYVVPIVPRLDVALGVLLGGGGMNLRMTRDDGQQKVWDRFWEDFGGNNPTYNYTRKLNGAFFIYQPTVNVEFALLRWLGFRLGVSYMGALGSSWRLDDESEFEIVGVPSNINPRGLIINGGIFLGTFIF